MKIYFSKVKDWTCGSFSNTSIIQGDAILNLSFSEDWKDLEPRPILFLYYKRLV